MRVNLFIIAFLLSITITPILRKIALKTNFVDLPNERKMHKKPKAYLGGIAIYLSSLITYLLYSDFYLSTQDKVLWIVGLLVLIVGLIDDKYDMRAYKKGIAQIVLSILAALILDDVYILSISSHVFNLTHIESVIIQASWIFIIMNAFNLIDGLDGLASGLGMISLTFIYAIMIMSGDMIDEVYVVIMIGTLLGFLYHNFYPSSIFLGDAGSMFIGFYIGVISFGRYKTATFTTVAVLILVAAIPLLDIILAMLRRKKNNKKLFTADAMHFHHRLIRHKFSPQKSVLIMYAIMIIYGIEAMIISFVDNQKIVIVSIIVILFITELIVEYLYMLSDRFTFFRKLINKHLRRKGENEQ